MFKKNYLLQMLAIFVGVFLIVGVPIVLYVATRSKNYSILEVVMLYGVMGAVIGMSVGLLRLSQGHLNQTQKYILLLMFCSNVASLMSIPLSFQRMNNLYILNASFIVEIILLIQIYRKELALPTLFMHGVALGFIIVTLYFLTFIDSWYNLNGKLWGASCFMPIILSLISFYRILTDDSIENLLAVPIFWANVGVLLYYSANIFVLLFNDFLTEYSKNLNINIWFVHAIFAFIFFTLLTVSLCIKDKRKGVPTIFA